MGRESEKTNLSMNDQLKGQVAIVTGASMGIGLAISREFTSRGGAVVMMARGRRKLNAACRSLTEEGCRATPVAGDVSNPEDVVKVCEETISQMGHVDVLVNNAGIAFLKPLEEFSIKDFDDMFAVNVRGAFLMIQALLPHMLDRDVGTIVNIASAAGKHSFHGGAVYSATKAAVRLLSEGLRLEVRSRSVRILTVNPGSVDTPFFVKAGRKVDPSHFLHPKHIATVVCDIINLDPQVSISEIDIHSSTPDGWNMN